jgi:hypothetical protein
MDKKTWQQPQLIVVLRSTPEEAVLTVCKGGGHSGPLLTYCDVPFESPLTAILTCERMTDS